MSPPILLQLRENIVGREQGKELVMQVPNRGIWGTAGVGGWNIDRAIENAGAYDTVVKKADRLDIVVQEEVLLMKVGEWIGWRRGFGYARSRVYEVFSHTKWEAYGGDDGKGSLLPLPRRLMWRALSQKCSAAHRGCCSRGRCNT